MKIEPESFQKTHIAKLALYLTFIMLSFGLAFHLLELVTTENISETRTNITKNLLFLVDDGVGSLVLGTLISILLINLGAATLAKVAMKAYENYKKKRNSLPDWEFGFNAVLFSLVALQLYFALDLAKYLWFVHDISIDLYGAASNYINKEESHQSIIVLIFIVVIVLLFFLPSIIERKKLKAIIASVIATTATYIVTHTFFGFGVAEASLSAVIAASILGALGYNA